MKITTTETVIVCTADELRASNGLADSLANTLRSCFNRIGTHNYSAFCNDETEENESED